MVVALTDVRLVLGERLGLRTDEDLDALEAQVASLDDDDAAVYALAVVRLPHLAAGDAGPRPRAVSHRGD